MAIRDLLEGLSTGQQLRGARDQRRMNEDQMALERLRIQDAIDRARERLDMDKEKYQTERQLDADMRARRRQSPDQLLQPQLSPLGLNGQGPLSPEQETAQQNAMQVLQGMGPLASIPLENQDPFQAIRGYQQENDAQSRMTAPIPEGIRGAYPTADQNMSLEDFLVSQQGLPSQRDVFNQDASMQQIKAKGAGGPDYGDAIAHARAMNTFYTGAIEQGLPLILNKYPEIQQQVEMMRRNSLSGSVSQDQIMSMLPFEAVQELNGYAEQYAQDRMTDSWEQMYGDQSYSHRGESEYGGSQSAPDSTQGGGTPYELMQQQQQAMAMQNVNSFFEVNPGAMNMPLFQNPIAIDYISRVGPDVNILDLIAEIRAQEEAAGTEPGVGVNLKRFTKTSGTSRVTKKKSDKSKKAVFEGDY